MSFHSLLILCASTLRYIIVLLAIAMSTVEAIVNTYMYRPSCTSNYFSFVLPRW